MSCGKIAYPDKRTARSAANAQRAAGVGRLYVYPCPRCGAWHLTSQRQRQRKREQRRAARR